MISLQGEGRALGLQGASGGFPGRRHFACVVTTRFGRSERVLGDFREGTLGSLRLASPGLSPTCLFPLPVSLRDLRCNEPELGGNDMLRPSAFPVRHRVSGWSWGPPTQTTRALRSQARAFSRRR